MRISLGLARLPKAEVDWGADGLKVEPKEGAVLLVVLAEKGVGLAPNGPGVELLNGDDVVAAVLKGD